MRLNRKTLTAANLIVEFRCVGVYDQFVKLTGFQPDNAVTYSDVARAQTEIGVDGELSGGKVYAVTSMSLHFQANSQGITVLETCDEFFNQDGVDVVPCEIRVTHPSIGKTRAHEGFMVSSTAGTSAQTLLKGSSFNFEVTNSLEVTA